MTAAQAKETLLLYRPDSADGRDPDVAAALALTLQDEELRQWFHQHCAYQRAVRAQFRRLEPPPQLKAVILARHRIIRPTIWWRNPLWLAAAASVVLLLSLTGLWLRPRTPDRFADYQSRLVRTVLREYHMDVVTHDMAQVRHHLSSGGAPADYVVPPGLERLSLTGGGLLRWRSHPVSMVCFDRGDTQMLFLFVVRRSALKDPPPATPQVHKVNKLLAASWSQGDKIYLLAGPEDSAFPRKYL